MRKDTIIMKTTTLATPNAIGILIPHVDKPTTPHRKKVFICSPFRGTVEKNILLARKACRYAVLQGFTPRAPHLYYPQILDDSKADERQLGIQLGLLDLAECDELWIIGNTISSGMEQEIEYANKWCMKIRQFNVMMTDSLFREVK